MRRLLSGAPKVCLKVGTEAQSGLFPSLVAAPIGTAALFTEDEVYEDFAFQAKFAGKQGVRTWVEITAKAIPDAPK